MTAPLPTGFVATCACGFFSLSMLQMVALATPLWGGEIGLSAELLGVAVGARSILPLIYSIHFGALMDAISVRRVIAAFATLCTLLPPLYPLLPQPVPLILLQLLLGLAAATVWLAAQTAVAGLAAADGRVTPRFSFFASAGTVVAPLLLGLVWDRAGPAAGFALMSGWGAAVLLSGLCLPERRGPAPRRRLRWSDLLPDPRTYLRAWQVLRRPVGAFVIGCTVLRLAGISMQESFYPVLLREAGLSAAAIGLLFAIGNLASAPATLAAPWWVRCTGSTARGLVAAVALSIAAIALTPALGGFAPLALAIAVYGFGLGVSMPLIFEMLARGLPATEQGLSAGLRGTANRLAAFVLPLTLGLGVEALGLGTAFWLCGLGLLVATLALARVFRGL